MENATKALLIAAAILVSILVISLGLVVYNMAAETVQGVNLNDTEIQAHNDKYIRYEGENERGSNVNAMLQTVMTNNLDEVDESRKVTVYWGTVDSETGTATKETVNGTDTILRSNARTSPKKVDTGRTYTVSVLYDADTGLITEIYVHQNSSSSTGNGGGSGTGGGNSTGTTE